MPETIESELVVITLAILAPGVIEARWAVDLFGKGTPAREALLDAFETAHGAERVVLNRYSAVFYFAPHVVPTPDAQVLAVIDAFEDPDVAHHRRQVRNCTLAFAPDDD